MTSGRMAYKTYFENIITKTKIFFFDLLCHKMCYCITSKQLNPRGDKGVYPLTLKNSEKLPHNRKKKTHFCYCNKKFSVFSPKYSII